MTAIQEYKDPMSGKINTFARGSIKFISIKPVKPGPNVVDGLKTTYIKVAGQPDKKIEATHSVSILLQSVDDDFNVVDPNEQGEWVSMGEKKLHPSHADKIQVKFDTGYKDILPGMVVSFPLKVSKNGDKTYYNGTLSGKTFNVLDESKAGAPAPRSNTTTSASAAATPDNGSVKIFGEITAINGNVATVNDEHMGPGDVVLSDEQLSKVKVGGRLGAFVVKATGAISGGFRPYGPAGQNASSGSRGKGKYDPVGISTGHAINVLANLRLAGFKGELEEAGKVSHDVTAKLIKEFSDTAGKDEGQSVGNAVKFAAVNIGVKGKTISAEELEAAAREAYTLAGKLRAYIEANTQGGAQGAAQDVPEPLKQASQPISPPPSTFEPPLDFDQDIPFAPVGLQHGISLLHAMP